jgi:serine/threonine protein kinase
VVVTSSQASQLFRLAKEKFISEASILLQLRATTNSRNIVSVFGFTEQYNTAYMVMEYLPGKSLYTLIRNQQQPDIAGLIEMLTGLLGGLSIAHLRRIWHRDIKPDNIVFRSDETPVLIDFGAARQDIHDLPKTQHHFMTPSYAAPEQVTSHGVIGPWTDIYSLAATMYHAVTGERPVSAHERMIDRLELTIDAQFASDKREHCFIQSIQRALQLEPGKRYQSASMWLRNLEDDCTQIKKHGADNQITIPALRHQSASTGLPYSASSSASLAKPVAMLPGKILVIAGGLLALSVTAALGIYFLKLNSSSPEPDEFNAYLQSLECSLVRQIDDTSSYSGVISQQDSLAQLQKLAESAGVQVDDIITIENTLCRAITRLNSKGPDLEYLSRDGPLQLNHSNLEYHDSQTIEFTVRNDNAAARHVIIDFIDNSGQLTHITPGVEPATVLAPGQSITFGEDGLYSAGDPYGNNILILYLSEQEPDISGAEAVISESLDNYIARADVFRAGELSRVSVSGGFIVFSTTQ